MARDHLVNLAESGHTTPVLLASDRGAEHYAYRGYRFTITHDRIGWWCHGGVGRPGEMIGMDHEGGWLSLSRKRIVRKITRAVDRRERNEGRKMATGYRPEEWFA